MDGAQSTPLWIFGLTVVMTLSVPPLYRGFRVLSSRWRWATFLGFLILPFVVYLLAVLGDMNTLLDQGLLDQDGMIGSPVLVNVWTIFWVRLPAITWTELSSLLVPAEEKAA